MDFSAGPKKKERLRENTGKNNFTNSFTIQAHQKNEPTWITSGIDNNVYDCTNLHISDKRRKENQTKDGNKIDKNIFPNIISCGQIVTYRAAHVTKNKKQRQALQC